jgi:hypothetical protein
MGEYVVKTHLKPFELREFVKYLAKKNGIRDKKRLSEIEARNWKENGEILLQMPDFGENEKGEQVETKILQGLFDRSMIEYFKFA